MISRAIRGFLPFLHLHSASDLDHFSLTSSILNLQLFIRIEVTSLLTLSEPTFTSFSNTQNGRD
jgi:hypothetical protein